MGVVPMRVPLGPVHMTCRVDPPGSEEDKVMEQVRSVDPPFLEDVTSTAMGAATIKKIMFEVRFKTLVLVESKMSIP